MWKNREEFKKWADFIYALVGPNEHVPAFVVQIPAEPLPLTPEEMAEAKVRAARWLAAQQG